jgi:hypothetical protein
MQSKKSQVFLIFTLMALGFSGQTVQASSAGGSDSCGLGWSVTQKKSFLATTTRGTTDAFFPPTFSMTFGTSGCDQHTVVQKDQEAVRFAAANFYPLRAQIAEGQGEYLTGLAVLLGCKQDALAPFASAVQKRFEVITREADAFQMVQNMKREVLEDPVLAQGCAIL